MDIEIFFLFNFNYYDSGAESTATPEILLGWRILITNVKQTRLYIVGLLYLRLNEADCGVPLKLAWLIAQH